MTNIKASIFAAFERMWFHITDALNKKADKTHEHDNIYNKAEVDVLLSNKSDAEHTHEVVDIIDLSSQLDTKVPATRKINDKTLNVDITLNAADVGADASGSATNALNESKAYTDTEVAKKATPAQVDSKIAEHNVDTAAHNDIRISLSELATKVNNFLDVDDATTDQLSELLTLISENADDIEAITNGKVNVSDIIDNLTTNTSDKPLSAAQGVVLKKLVDDLQAEFDVHGHTSVNGVTPEWDGQILNADTYWLAAWTGDGSKIKATNKGELSVGYSVNANYANNAGYAASAGFKISTDKELNNYTETGVYTIKTSPYTNGVSSVPSAHWGTLIVDGDIGTPYQIFIPDGETSHIYKRSLASNTWSEISAGYANSAGYAGSAGSADYANSAGYAANASCDENGNNIALNYQTIYGNRNVVMVDGDANTYYPVLIQGLGQNSFAWSHLHISRNYYATAPDSWNTSTHKGGLTLSLRWTGDSGWGGNDKRIAVEEFHEQYSSMVGGLTLTVNGLLVWLRGGTAEYIFQADYGNSLATTVYLGTFTASDNRTYPAKSSPDTASVYGSWYDRGGTYNGNATGLVLGSSNYGTSLPSAGTAGRVFFKKV